MISRGVKFADLPQGARIGTSALRRQAQLLKVRPDLEMVIIRGNVETRIRKLEDDKLDAVILAAAGLKRLGFTDKVTEYLPVDLSIPAIGQGALGIECRLDDAKVRETIAFFNHPDTSHAVRAERALLWRCEGGCQVPIAAHGEVTGEPAEADRLRRLGGRHPLGPREHHRPGRGVREAGHHPCRAASEGRRPRDPQRGLSAGSLPGEGNSGLTETSGSWRRGRERLKGLCVCLVPSSRLPSAGPDQSEIGLRNMHATMTILNKGYVYLIGAGPGDPGLITVKGRECIARADVILYDYLANERLLQHAAAGAELIYAGKVGGAHNREQRQINELLVAKAREGKVVARLKGGDPFVFGRGGEECEALVAAGIPFEVVPGVTAGIGAPAYAGIPLTHRSFTTSVAFVTGHEHPGKEVSEIDWERLSLGSGTIVFYMGMKNLPQIAANLMTHGRAPETPVALIRWGTRPEQEVLTGTLADIAEKARRAGFKAPAITVVGEVVRLREKLRWFDNRPLFGRGIMVTRAADQAGEFSASPRRASAPTSTNARPSRSCRRKTSPNWTQRSAPLPASTG